MPVIKPSPEVEAVLRGMPGLRAAIRMQCSGEWDRVTVDAKGAITVHNSAARAREAGGKGGLRIPAPAPRKRAPARKPSPPVSTVTSIDPDLCHGCLVGNHEECSLDGTPDCLCPLAHGPADKTYDQLDERPVVSVAKLLDQPKQRQFTTRITSEARDALTAAERPDVKGVVIEKISPDEREARRRAKEVKPVVVPAEVAGPPPTDDELLARLGNGVVTKWQKGLPPDVPYEFLPDVLAMYGLDHDLTNACLRHPDRVELRPESFHANKRYVVLGFWRGDLNVILGLRNPAQPCIIAAYVGSKLEHDIHRVGHAGGGGAKKETGVPKNPRAVAQRLRGLGAEVVLDMSQDTAPVKYKGQELGSISAKPTTTRDTAEADYQRMQRKIHAIDRRASMAS